MLAKWGARSGDAASHTPRPDDNRLSYSVQSALGKGWRRTRRDAEMTAPQHRTSIVGKSARGQIRCTMRLETVASWRSDQRHEKYHCMH